MIVSSQGLADWWLQMNHVSTGVAAIWFKILFERIFGRQQRFPYHVRLLVAVLLLLHLSSWLFISEQSDVNRVIFVLSQDLLAAAAVLALYYQSQ